MTKLLLTIRLLMLVALAVTTQQPSPDFILTGGKVCIANPVSLQAAAVGGERVVAVGKPIDIAALLRA